MLSNRLRNFYFEAEDSEATLKFYKEGLYIEQKVFEDTHPNVIVTLSNIGEIHKKTDKHDLAIQVYSRVMSFQRIRHGSCSARAASSLNDIGLIQDKKDQPEIAMFYLREALTTRREVLGEDHLDVAATTSCLGTIFFKKK